MTLQKTFAIVAVGLALWPAAGRSEADSSAAGNVQAPGLPAAVSSQLRLNISEGQTFTGIAYPAPEATPVQIAVRQVEFALINAMGVKVYEHTELWAPYCFLSNTNDGCGAWDTTPYADGLYRFRAVATRTDGLIVTSEINVEIRNHDHHRDLDLDQLKDHGQQVDVTDADNYVNRFLKAQVHAGDRRVAASGTWWGPTSKFFQNQLWTVAKDVRPGAVYAPSAWVPMTFTCLMPGKLDGIVKNTLGYPTLLYNFGNGEPDIRHPSGPNTLEVFHTLWRRALTSGSIEQRARCQAFEEANDPFDEGNVPTRRRDEVRNNFNITAWFGSRYQPPRSDPTLTGNHLALPSNRPDLLDGHAWYDKGVEYVYAVPENAADLLGATVSGTVTVQGFASVCKQPNCPHTTEPIEIHHHAVKIEQDDEDYWVYQHLVDASQWALPSNLRQQSRVSFQVDTTHLTDGWHILSYHVHALDLRAIRGMTGKQLASEVKIPICVNNHNIGACR